MTEYSSNNNYDQMSTAEIEALIEKTNSFLSSAREGYKKTEAKLEETKAKLAPVVEEFRRLDKEKRNAEVALQAARPVINDHEKQLRDLKHWLNRAQLALLEKEKFQEISRELDTLTANAKWREFAFEHQISGAKRLALVGGKGILADKRGLGKTLTSLITCDMVKARKVFVFAPKETIRNFQQEIKEWAPDRTLISLIGKNKFTRDFMLDTLKTTDEFIVTMNLEAWRRDDDVILKIIELQPDTVIIDEAHFIKGENTVTAQGVQRIVHAQNMCMMCGKDHLVFDGKYMACGTKDCGATYKPKDPNCMSVKHVIPMTGTPILNSPEDMWMLLHLIDRASFPDKKAFLEQYCQKNSDGKWIFKKPRKWMGEVEGGEAALIKKLGPSIIQRDRNQAGIKIPPQKIQFYDIEFDKEKYPRQFRAYRELQEKFMLFSDEYPDEVKLVDIAIAHITRSRQMLVWPRSIQWKDPISGTILWQCDVDESIKVDNAVKMVKGFIEEGERVVLFSKFVDPLKEIAARLSTTPVESYGGRLVSPALLYGQTPDYEREHIRYDFDRRNKSNEYDIVLAHYQVGGQSLNFTAATQMVLVDREWSPGREDQAAGRIDRIGQTEETTVHIPQIIDTMDTWLDKLIKMKQQITDGFEVELNYVDMLREGIANGEI